MITEHDCCWLKVSSSIWGIIRTSLNLWKTWKWRKYRKRQISLKYLWLHLLHGQISQSFHKYCFREFVLWSFSSLVSTAGIWRANYIFHWLISFVGAGLYCCLKRRYRYYLLTCKFWCSRPLLLFEEKIQHRFNLLAFKFCYNRSLLLFK